MLKPFFMKINTIINAASLLVATLCLSVSAHAATVLAPGALWEYTAADPTLDPAWNNSTGGWNTGSAPFGNVPVGELAYGTLDFGYATYWAPGDFSTNLDGSFVDDLWVRTSINVSSLDLGTILWDLGVDNGFKLYANGILVAQNNAEMYTNRWEYSGDFGSALIDGVNVIALALEDHGGLTAFDMQITGREKPNASVPEAGTSFFLFGLGLSGIGFLTSRLKARRSS